MTELHADEYAARAAVPPPPDIAPVKPRSEAFPWRPFLVLAVLAGVMIAGSFLAFALFMAPP